MKPLLAELKRRNVIRSAGLYLAGSWLLVQIVGTVLPMFGAPDWVGRSIVVLLAIGFIPALVFSWLFELTPQGLKRDENVRPEESIAPQTARRMNRLIIAVLVAALAYFAVDKFVLSPRREAARIAVAPPSNAASLPNESQSLADPKSIAVLPFENRSAGGEDAAFLADGIQQDLINTLSRVPGLKVIAQTAVLRYRGSALAMPQIAAELRVTHLLEAGVQRAGERVRVNVQLVRAADGQTVWSERYDRSLSATNIFDLQEEITQALAGMLQLKLGRPAGEKLLSGTTGNLAAYEAFLKGRKEFSGGSPPEAVRLLQEAVRLDPNYALAHGALAEAYVSMANGGLAPAADAFPLVRASARRALELDDHIVQAYTALAEYAFHYEWNWAESEKAMLRALAIDPNYANAYVRHAGHLSAWGRFDEARTAALRAAELSPQKKNMAGLGVLLAERRYQDVLNLTADEASSENRSLLGFRGIALFHTGNQTEGLARLERGMELYPDFLSLQANLGWAYGRAGQTAKARGILDHLLATAKSRFVSPLELAQVAAGLDDRDLAFAQLEQAFEQRDPNLPFIGSDANFDPIRTDPRFRDLLKRLKLDVFFPATPDK